jgi:hypothetical protein
MQPEQFSSQQENNILPRENKALPREPRKFAIT